MLEGYIIPWSISIGSALLILLIGLWLAGKAKKLVKKILAQTIKDEILVNFLGTVAYAILLIAVILAAVSELGVNITSLLAIVGAAGLAIALALKDSLANLAAGVMIIMLKPFKTGDFVTAGSNSGIIDEIGLFYTMLHTPDNQRVIMPNSSIVNSTITNTSALETRRIDLVISVSYGDHIGKARDVILGILDAEARVLKEPAPLVAVSELADSSVNFNVRPWVKTADYWPVRYALLENIKLGLEQAGLTIPFPQRDVHLHAANDANNA